jgi:hypothetical protein
MLGVWTTGLPKAPTASARSWSGMNSSRFGLISAATLALVFDEFIRVIVPASLAAYLLGPDAGFITGSDFLMDGEVTAVRVVGGSHSAVQG